LVSEGCFLCLLICPDLLEAAQALIQKKTLDLLERQARLRVTRRMRLSVGAPCSASMPRSMAFCSATSPLVAPAVWAFSPVVQIGSLVWLASLRCQPTICVNSRSSSRSLKAEVSAKVVSSQKLSMANIACARLGWRVIVTFGSWVIARYS